MLKTRQEWQEKIDGIWNDIIPVSWGRDMLQDWQEEVETILKDHCAEDAEIRRLALAALPEEDVNGNTNGVPSVVDIVEKLVEKIVLEMGERILILKEENEKLKFEEKMARELTIAYANRNSELIAENETLKAENYKLQEQLYPLSERYLHE